LYHYSFRILLLAHTPSLLRSSTIRSIYNTLFNWLNSEPHIEYATHRGIEYIHSSAYITADICVQDVLPASPEDRFICCSEGDADRIVCTCCYCISLSPFHLLSLRRKQHVQQTGINIHIADRESGWRILHGWGILSMMSLRLLYDHEWPLAQTVAEFSYFISSYLVSCGRGGFIVRTTRELLFGRRCNSSLEVTCYCHDSMLWIWLMIIHDGGTKTLATHYNGAGDSIIATPVIMCLQLSLVRLVVKIKLYVGCVDV